MKAVCIKEFVKSYDELEVSEVANPRPKEDEVVVQIAAAGVNFVDLLYARGKHQNNRSLVTPPFILGLEFAGTVLSSPPDCHFSPGDQVFGGGLGSYASQITVKASSLHMIPSHWTVKEAAGLGATAPVSYGALISRGGLKRDETVLVHAAAGGLGLMAVQIAKAVGARVIATAGSKSKLDVAKRFGADECVDYTENEEWWKEVMSLTKGQGVEVVFDSVGLVDRSLKCLKYRGRILIVGFAGIEGNLENIAMNRILLKQAQIIGYRFGDTDRKFPKETLEIWAALEALWKMGALKPTVYDREYRGLESVISALNDLSKRRVWGKAVIMVDEDLGKSKL